MLLVIETFVAGATHVIRFIPLGGLGEPRHRAELLGHNHRSLVVILNVHTVLVFIFAGGGAQAALDFIAADGRDFRPTMWVA